MHYLVIMYSGNRCRTFWSDFKLIGFLAALYCIVVNKDIAIIDIEAGEPVLMRSKVRQNRPEHWVPRHMLQADLRLFAWRF